MRFVKESVIRARPERVFAFHELPDALRRLTPPWERARVVEHAGSLRVGARAIVETRLFGVVPVRWVARHTAYDPPHMFEDVQVSGPLGAHSRRSSSSRGSGVCSTTATRPRASGARGAALKRLQLTEADVGRT